MAELELRGAQADYTVEQVPNGGAWVPVLVGVGPFTAGEVHPLEGVEVLAFADGRLALGLTGLAQEAASAEAGADLAPVSTWRQLTQWISNEPLGGEEAANPEYAQAATKAPWASSAPQVASLSNPSAAAAVQTPQPDASQPTPGPEITGPLDASGPVQAEGAGPKGMAPVANTGAATLVAPSAGGVVLPPAGAGQPAGSTGSVDASAAKSPVPVAEQVGSAGPDRLLGGEGADRLDGGLNTEALNRVFFEELLGAGGDDQLVYRGFSGDSAVTDVKALLQGGAGRDVLDVMLDGRTSIQVSGGDGFDGLVLQTLVGPASPWDSSFAQWHWDVSTGTALLNAAHVNGEQSGSLSETAPDLEWVASGASTPLTLVRPEASAVVMRGTEGADWILAGPQVSTIQAMGGDDVVLAKAGVTVDLGAGINTLYADSADFTLTYADAPFGVRVNLANRLGLVFDEDAQLHAIDRLMDVPLHVVGSAHADVLVGDSANNTLRTGGGADELWGGAGADHFVVDVGSGSGPVRLADWNFAEGDQLTLNLTDWDTVFSRFEVRNEQDQTLWSGDLGNPTEEGALLSLMLSAETDTLYWTDAADQPFAWVTFDAPVDSLSAEQWASVLSVDYL